MKSRDCEECCGDFHGQYSCPQRGNFDAVVSMQDQVHHGRYTNFKCDEQE